MSFEQVRINIQKHLSENFDELAATAIAWDNVKFKPTIGTPWVRFSIQGNISNFVSIGGANVKTRRLGLLFAQVFIPEGTGTLRANQIADAVKTILEATQLATGENFKAATQIEVGNSSPGWYQVNVSIPFHYDEQITTRLLSFTKPIITAPAAEDEITEGDSVTVSGTCPDDTAIEIKVNGVKVGDATVTSGAFTYTWTAPEAQEGLQLVAVGNNSGSSTIIILEILSAITRTTPLSDIVAGAFDCDLDATLLDSYGGSGDTWSNIVTSPASGLSQTDWDLALGTTVGADSGDPVFTGTAGDPGARFVMGSGDGFIIKNGNNAFINAMHKTTGQQPFTIIATGQYPDKGAGTTVWPLYNTGKPEGVNALLLNANFQFDQIGGGATNRVSEAHGFTAGVDFVMAVSYDGSEVRWWFDSSTSAADSITPDTTTADASNDPALFFKNAAAAASNGTVKSIAIANKVLSDAEMAAVIAQLNIRHNTTYGA